MGEAEKTERRVVSDWWVADVGNSRIKTARFSSEGRILSNDSKALPFGWKSDRNAVRRGADGTKAAVASVNPALLSEWLHHLDSSGADVRLVLQSDGSVFKSGLVTAEIETPETTGVDRVLGCLGALLESQGRTVLVIDCGTATTLNVMTADRRFHGGLIMPGRWLLAKALQEGTAALPEVLPAAPVVGVGKSTKDCLRFGISAAMIGGIRDGVETIHRSFPDAEAFITGGDSEFVAAAFPNWPRSEDLTLHGLYWYATNLPNAS